MINAITTLSSGQNTTGIILPWLSITANGKRGGPQSVVDGRFALTDGVDASDVQGRGASAFITSSVLSGVRVASFGILTSLAHDPLKSLTRITSVATTFTRIAVDDFLRAKTSSRDTSASEEIGGFYGFGGREGPARTALSLVLNWGGLSSGDPVDGGHLGEFEGVSLGDDWGVNGGGSDVAGHFFFELSTSHVCEFGETESGTGAVGVESSDDLAGGQEVLESFLFLGISCVSLVPVLVVLLEGSEVQGVGG